jgi:cobalamin 5'-phosphate synthase/cobalamin synthase
MPGASLRAIAGAISFLTLVPVGRVVAVESRDVARGLVLFPAVGAGVGALTGAIAVALYPWVPALLAAGVALAAAVLVTGALHVDALADTFDAAGGRSRERALEIMRDSRLGTFGACALALDLLLKAGAISALVLRGGTVPALIAAGALSRAASPPLAALLPYPRAGGGPGSVLVGVSRLHAAAAVALGIAIAALAVRGDALWLGLACGVVTLAAGLLYRGWLGGVTGDCLGAATEVCETTVLIVAAGLA